LTFKLCKENYAIPILKVKEIISMIDITRVPRMPRYIKGILNLRGKIISVIDLRIKFNLDEREYSERTSIIVVELAGENGIRTVGFIVDEVDEVINISDDDIEPPPEYGASIDQNSLFGMGKVDERVIMLIDIDNILVAEKPSE